MKDDRGKNNLFLKRTVACVLIKINDTLTYERLKGKKLSIL